MFRKTFAALCLAGLAALCAGEVFVVTFKPFPCDYELHMVTTSPSGQDTSIAKFHGNFSYESNSEGITLERPDLGTNPGGSIFMVDVSSTEEECSCSTSEPLGSMGTIVFEHKEEDTLDGKKCFKYYNNTEETICWADADNNPLAMDHPEEGENARTRITVVVKTTAFPRETFVLPQGYKCTEKPEVFQAPSEEVFAAACPAPTPTPASSSIGAAGIHGLSALAVLCAVFAAVLML